MSDQLIPVTLEIRWHELFGEGKGEISAGKRRARWEEWKSIAPAEAVEYWTDGSACRDCVHKNADWCSIVELPCTVNPVLTFRHGMIGMACCGTGLTPRQPELFDQDDIFEESA